jgi:hypothetical protein
MTTTDSFDDMVITPRLETQISAPRVKARVDRRIDQAKRRHGLFSRLIRAKATRRAAKYVGARLGMRGPPGGGRALTAGGGVVAGLAIAAVVAAVIAREVSGRSFENMGKNLNSLLLGEVDDDARARMWARDQIIGTPGLAFYVGQQGKVDASIRAIHNDLYKQRLNFEKNRSAIREDKDFQVNDNWADLAVEAVRRIWKKVWASKDMDAEARQFQKAIEVVRTMRSASKDIVPGTMYPLGWGHR